MKRTQVRELRRALNLFVRALKECEAARWKSEELQLRVNNAIKVLAVDGAGEELRAYLQSVRTALDNGAGETYIGLEKSRRQAIQLAEFMGVNVQPDGAGTGGGTMSRYWILDAEGNHIPTDDVLAWGRWLESGGEQSKRVAWDERGEVSVSTVFLGLDHSFGGKVPILYETMVFGGPQDGYCERYATRAEALDGHAKALRVVDGIEADSR